MFYTLLMLMGKYYNVENFSIVVFQALKKSFIFFCRFEPLHHAALGGNGEIVMALLEFTKDVNAKDKKGKEIFIQNP